MSRPILKAGLEKAPLDIDHPSWVEDISSTSTATSSAAACRRPTNRATLERIVGWMHAKLLKPRSALWEFYVFEGMKDNEIGLYSRCITPASTAAQGAALTNMIYDVTPVPRQVDPRP